MVKQALRRIGLTEGEIKVYLALLEIGSSSTGKLIQKSKISGSKVYEVLDRLIEKGLVSFIVKNNVKHFEATSPERILSYLDEKENELKQERQTVQKIIPDLILRQKKTYKSDIRIFTSFEGIKTVNEEIVNSLKRGEEWLSMGLTEQPKPWEIYFNKKQKERSRKGIILKHLINERYRSLFKKRKKLPHTKFRFLSKEFEMPTSIEIYGESVAIMILVKENPLAIVINNQHIAISFRKYFDYLWKNAKKF